MGYAFTSDDVAFLRSAAGVAAVAEVNALPFTDSSRLHDVGVARKLLGERFAPVVETVLLRRRATSKLDNAAEWLFTDDALQQATASPVARHRASRFAGRDVHDVTCSIGADLFALNAVASRCVGSDLDPVRLAMARNNVPGQLVVQADALKPVSRATAVTADPARRDSSGRRKWHPQDFVPPLDELSEVYAHVDLAVKCAPGIDFAVAPWADEIELVSLDGAVREACLWTRGLATEGVSRRATVIHGDDSWTVTDAEPDDCPVAPPGEWIIDPDGAVVRAGLVRHYAARHGLWQLDERIAYLSGDTPPAGIRAFRVLDHGHYTEKALKSLLKTRGIGRLEILVRGLDVDPNTLRKRLKLVGRDEATVVLTRIGTKPVMVLCRAERT
ncbi:hypothetical protein C8D87_111231 [Lentzea atacamensis]|uniref:THUMP-like domain-containing protein n=1 Tax=Lentzea atacamensis TaxID=531938 RepID=A0ABX9DYN7_9PSEU|nr:class I SAM-dependent methyltransferase [Lentzea atacamensis]RAS60812.1 hypothetical protein C8D87_111231 [Lentzea atacamensis]